MGATLYLEPAATLDVDVFVILSAAPSGLLVSLSPIYEYLKSRGATVQDEHIVLGDWPVQFLIPSSELELDAIVSSVPVTIEGVRTWVMLAEHLVAIALSTGRSKDHIRILQFMEQGAVDQALLDSILARHGLTAKWAQFESKYLEGHS